jgi:hypothetical protein
MINFLVISGVIVTASAAAAAVSILALRCLFWLISAGENPIEASRAAVNELVEAA